MCGNIIVEISCNDCCNGNATMHYVHHWATFHPQE